MKTIQRSGNFPELNSHSSPGFIFIHKVLEWLVSFNPQTGLFDPTKDIKIDSHDHPFHHHISCTNGFPSWAQGQSLVEDLLHSLAQPVIQFGVVKTEEGVRFYAVIITKVQVSWRAELVNKAYAFGALECGSRFFIGERTFVEPLIWEENLDYRHFLRFM